jgi:hypothetical protein
MGTSNFHSERTSCIYAVSERYTDEETGEEVYNEFLWEDVRDNINYAFKEIDKDKSNTWFYSDSADITLHESLRSYPATSLGWFYSSFSYAGINLTINFLPKMVAGYYEGFNLDFELQFEDEWSYESYIYDNDNEEGMIEKILNEHLYQKPESAGIIKIHGTNFIYKLRDKIEEGQNLIENVFKQNSDGYKVVARFSNGETIYEKCNAM